MNTRFARLAGLTAAMALTMTAAAQAHPGVYSVDAKVAKTFARQTITVNATGGTFKPSTGAMEVPFNATAAQVEAALWADPAIGYDNIDVTGANGGPYTLTWTGTKAGAAVAPLAPDPSLLAGGAATATDAVLSTGGADVRYLDDLLGTTMATQKQYVIANDGYALGYKETNGVAGGGMLNLKALPGTYRAPMTPEEKIGYSPARTGIQPHATCTGVPALEDATNIWSWQTRADNDPFYAYIPWQKTAAGLGDDPAKWIPVVKTLTSGNVDLSTLNTPAEFTAACTGLGGSYHPADTSSSVASGMVADAVTAATAPLNAQIAQLTSAKTAAETATSDLEKQLAAAKADAAAARAEAAAANAAVARLNAGVGRLTIAKDGPAALDGTLTPVAVTGPAGAPVLVRLVLSPGQAAKLHRKSRLLGTVTQVIGADGKTVVNIGVARKLTAAAQKAGVKKVTVDAISGDRYVRIPAGA